MNIPHHALRAMGDPTPDTTRVIEIAQAQGASAHSRLMKDVMAWKNVLLGQKLHVAERTTTKYDRVEVVHSPKGRPQHMSLDLRVVDAQPGMVERAKALFGKARKPGRGTGIDTRPDTLASRQAGRRLRAERKALREAA